MKKVNAFRTGKDTWYWNKSNTKKVKVKNLKKLKYDYGLEKLAMQRAAEIAVQFDHTRPDGRDCYTVFDDAGYTLGAMRAEGENIAYGYDTAGKVHTAWTEADKDYEGQSHRRNMLGVNYDFARIGIAHVTVEGKDFWVEEFSKRGTGVKKTKAKNGNKTVKIRLPKKHILTEEGRKYVTSDIQKWNDQTDEWEYMKIPVAE